MATDLLQLDFVVKQVGLDKALTQTAKFEREIMKTVKAYQQGQITQDRYRKSLLNVKRDLVAYTKDWGNSSLSIQKANSVVQKFIATQDTLNNSLKRNSNALQQTKRNTNQLGVLFQQSGYQIGDFAVQVQSGTNVMVAFGQQATQLVGTFAMLARSTAAIAAFSTLGIVIPIATALAGAFMRARDSADDLGRSVKEVFDNIVARSESIGDLLEVTFTGSLGVAKQQLLGVQEVFQKLDQQAFLAKMRESGSLFNEVLEQSIDKAQELLDQTEKTKGRGRGFLLDEEERISLVRDAEALQNFNKKITEIQQGPIDGMAKGFVDAFLTLQKYDDELSGNIAPAFKKLLEDTGLLAQFEKELMEAAKAQAREKRNQAQETAQLISESLSNSDKETAAIERRNAAIEAFKTKYNKLTEAQMDGELGVNEATRRAREELELVNLARANNIKLTGTEYQQLVQILRTYQAQRKEAEDNLEITRIQKDATDALVQAEFKVLQAEVDLLRAKGKNNDADSLSVQLAGDRAYQAIMAKAETEEEAAALQDAADEAKMLAIEAARVANGTRDAKEEAQELAKATREAERAMSALANMGDNLDKGLIKAQARVQALKNDADAANAAVIAGARFDLEKTYEDALFAAESFDELVQATKEYNEGLATLDATAKALAEGKKLEEAARNGAKALSDAEKDAERLTKELQGPMVTAVDSVSNAFGDFIARGLTDFKGFVKQILASFQNMIAQMIAMAVRNRIMLSLGIGGITPAAAAAGQVAGLGTASTMLGSIGTGTGFAGIAGGTGFLGGAANTISGLAGGGAGVFNVAGNAALAGGGAMATIGAAVPLVAAGVALFSLFGGSKPLVSAENMKRFNDALVMTGQEIEATGHEAMVTAKALADVAGGFEKLTEKTKFFYENFYTEGERRADAAAQATDQLNKTFADLELAVPQTHAEFRQLIEAQDLMTDAGRETYNALLNVSGAFVTLRGTADQAAQALKLGRARELEQKAKAGEKITEQYLAKEIINQQIEALGTTAELNEYLITELDRTLSMRDVPASARTGYLDKAREQLNSFIEDTTYVQNIQREFYQGIKVPVDQMKSMLKQVGGTRADLSAFERFGELGVGGRLSAEFMEKFGKYGMYKVLPYITQVELFIKEVSQTVGEMVEAIRVTNFRGDLGVINKKIEVSAGRVTVGYAALASGYRKIVEAVNKIEDYYERDFAALRAEYSGAAGLESSTAVKSITDRISSIIELPKRLVAVIESSMATLSKQADLLDGSFTKVQQEYFKVKRSGQQVSEGLQEAYYDMLEDRQDAAQAAAEAQKRVEELTLFIRTIEGAVQGFKDSVERVVTSPIEDALAVFLPTELDSLAQNVRTQIKEILGSMGEGTLDTFETGLVTLSDLLASNSITVDQFNNSFKLMQDVFEGNLSLTEQYTTKQQTVIEKLSRAYEDFTSRLQNLLGVVQGGIDSLLGQATSANVVASRRGSQAYLRTVARTGEFDAGRLERAVGAVTGQDTAGFGSRQDFLRYVADTTNVLNAVKGTLEGQLDTLQMKQVKSILKIEETSTSSAESLQSIQSLLAEFLGVGGRVPSFAAGGYHSGGLRIVGERGPELEATGPSRIIPAGEFAVGGVSALRQEIAEMKDQLYNGLVQVAKYTRKSSETLNKFDYDGLPSDRGY